MPAIAIKCFLALSADPLKQSLSFQLVKQPFVDILLQIHLKLGSGASLGNHFQDDAHAFVGYARRKGEERSIKLISLFRERRIFLLKPLVGNRQGFLFIRDELVDALAVSLQETLYHLTVFFQKGAAGGNDIDRKGGGFKVAQIGEDVHPHARSLARVGRSEQSCVKGSLGKGCEPIS